MVALTRMSLRYLCRSRLMRNRRKISAFCCSSSAWFICSSVYYLILKWYRQLWFKYHWLEPFYFIKFFLNLIQKSPLDITPLLKLELSLMLHAPLLKPPLYITPLLKLAPLLWSYAPLLKPPLNITPLLKFSPSLLLHAPLLIMKDKCYSIAHLFWAWNAHQPKVKHWMLDASQHIHMYTCHCYMHRCWKHRWTGSYSYN